MTTHIAKTTATNMLMIFILGCVAGFFLLMEAEPVVTAIAVVATAVAIKVDDARIRRARRI